MKRICDEVAAEPEHKKQGGIKRRLPGFMFHASFPNGRRVIKDAIPSGLCILDFDGIDDPAGLWEKIKEQALSMGCLISHLTPSTRGLRLVMPLIKGMDVPGSQAEYARRFGIGTDAVVKDLARFSFAVPRDYFYHIDWEGLFEINNEEFKIQNEENIIQNEKQKASKTEEPKEDVAKGHDEKGGNGDDDNNNSKGAGTQPTVSAAGSNGVATEYLGIPYGDIIRAWLKEYLSNKPGYSSFDAPCEGDRNNTLYDLCRELRNITDYNFAQISAIVPRWGLTEGEVDNTIASALKADRRIPYILNKVVRRLKAGGEQSEEGFKAEMYMFNEQYLARMPKLPAPLRACLAGVERRFHMPIIVGVMPLMCSYADKVMYRYSDGRLRRPNLLSFVLGRFASGKSSVTSKLEILMEPMKEADEAARDKDDEAREQNNTRKDTERGKVNKDFIKKLNIDTTDAALLRMQKIATKQGNSIDGRLLPLKNFMFTEEASSVKQAMKNGKMMEAWRVAFDNGEWGKDTASDTAQAGLVKMSLDIVAECTLEVFSKLINGENFENGTASRLLLSFTPDERFAYMPKFAEETEQTRRQMLEAVRMCREEKGIIEDKRLCRAFEKWCNDVADECRETEDNVRDDFRKRASVIGATCAVICAILWGKHTKEGQLVIKREAIDFGLLMADYCLESQVAVFKHYYEERPVQISFEGIRKGTKNKVLFDELPDVFTRDMVKERKGNLSNTSISNFISKLKKDNLIEEISKNTYRKKTTKEKEDKE
ncbi:MAG: hypothetical protein IKP84_08505 [Prevotella sp.]|nr:hypothetical protein [Prevotella sp.]